MSTPAATVIDYLTDETTRTGHSGAQSTSITTDDVQEAARQGTAAALREHQAELEARTADAEREPTAADESSGGNRLKLLLLVGIAAAVLFKRRGGSSTDA